MINFSKVSIPVFMLLTSSAFGQYLGYSPINDSDVNKWIPKFEIEYRGAYHFGDSEGESTLLLFFTGTEVIAQIRSGQWNSDGTQWVMHYENLSGIEIGKNGNFQSNQYKGEFVIYSGEEENQKCLKIYDSWSGVTEKQGEYELGCRLKVEMKDMFPGQYPTASIEDLNPARLAEMKPQELKIMRNEIFARYGYQFREGGEMEAYFKKQSWYRAQHSDVNGFLTTVEKRNIARILKEEKSR